MERENKEEGKTCFEAVPDKIGVCIDPGHQTVPV